MILPDVEAPDTAAFWEAARRHQLAVQRCLPCGRLRFPPHRHCGHCASGESEWTVVSGRGQIWSFAEVHGPTLPELEPFLPFPVVVVELEEDPRIRMPGNVIARPAAAINSVPADQLAVGARVQVWFEDISDSVALPRWILLDHD